jgi:imidazoleglycerol phosphate synthase glutamine amidotransferase subunit HisH
MSVAVVDSGGANISSVLHALRRLGADPVFTADAAAIRAADRVILPGVGAAGRAMEALFRIAAASEKDARTYGINTFLAGDRRGACYQGAWARKT